MTTLLRCMSLMALEGRPRKRSSSAEASSFNGFLDIPDVSCFGVMGVMGVTPCSHGSLYLCFPQPTGSGKI